MRLVYVATDPITAFRLMEGQLAYMREHGFHVTVITSPGPLLDQVARREGVDVLGIPMRREPAPLEDAVAVARLVAALRRLRPDIVNAGTPKAGLLGVLAARAARVPCVIYLLRGLRFEGASGARRLLLASTEHVAGHLAHRVIVNSPSLRDRFVALGCAPQAKTWIPGAGSSNGVDVDRFARTEQKRSWAVQERTRLGIPPGAIVCGFVGRFTRDKGLSELVHAFRRAVGIEPRLHLLLVGDHDETDPLPTELRQALLTEPKVTTTGFVAEPARYYALMDLFVFPSHREGFPNAPLEAAAAELPVLAATATGTVDAVIDGETGCLFPVGDADAICEALVRYARHPELRTEQGRRGRARVDASFRREVVWGALAEEYRTMAASHRRP